MKLKVIALIAGIALVTVASGVVGADRSQLSATTSMLTAADVASALGIRWWSYTLKFGKPIAQVVVRPCELRRRADGGWDRTQLAPATGYAHAEAELTEAEVKIIIQSNASSGEFWLELGPQSGSSKFTTKPDFERTYTSPTEPVWVDGCLCLAIEEKEPSTIHGREQDMVRVIALEITAE